MACAARQKDGVRFYIKKGYFITKWNHQPVPRYVCRRCGRYFSSHTFRSTWRQKKPYLNHVLFEWYASATTQRRIARVLKINRKTVSRKFLFMAQLSRAAHERRLEARTWRVSEAQFDEVETFEHTRLKPLAIALAVDAISGEIISSEVSSMPSKGKLAAIAYRKYGPRPDNRPRARKKAFAALARVLKPNATLTTDAHPAYPALARHYLPEVRFAAVKSRGEIRFLSQRRRRRNENDPLFTLNYTAAKLRHDLSRLARRVWVTTKKASRLQAHLDLYIAYNNGYTLNT
jgi:hypothetical protein